MTGDLAGRDAARRRPGIGQAAVLIVGIAVLTRLGGFGRQVVFAHTAGTTCPGTNYTAANMVPNVVVLSLDGGDLRAALARLRARACG